MRDVDYTILEKRIRRLERLIANEQLDQKNEFLGLGKKKVGSGHSQKVLDIFNDMHFLPSWIKDGNTRGWKDNSGPGYIELLLTVNNRNSGSKLVEYTVTLHGRDLKKINLNIERTMYGKKYTDFNKEVPLATPKQINKAADIIMDYVPLSL